MKALVKTVKLFFTKYTYLNGFKLPLFSDGDFPKWKSKNVVSKTHVVTQTKHYISSVRSARTITSFRKRLENLTYHLNKYPEAKILAVREGAIPLLLRLRRMEPGDEEIQAELRESLSLLGHTDTLPNRGIRILSIDGGGTRGVLAVEMLRKLEKLTGKHAYELFDLICGVSTGAILACLIGPHKKSLEECSALYKEISAKIFDQSRLWGTSSLVWSHSYYDTHRMESLLKNHIGTIHLSKTSRDSTCPKIAIVSTVVNKPQILAYVFRNYELPYRVISQYAGSSRHQLWEAVRASAAAPLYFEEFRLGEFLHQDGGILLNNPTALAIHEAQYLWPDSPLQCVLSLGTGRKMHAGMPLSHLSRMLMAEQAGRGEGELKGPMPKAVPPKESTSSSASAASSLKTKFLKILDSATDTENVHTILRDLLPSGVYFRFNPHLTEVTAIDEIRPQCWRQLETDATMYVRRNEETFDEVAIALLAPKSISQSCGDWMKLRYLEGMPNPFHMPKPVSN